MPNPTADIDVTANDTFQWWFEFGDDDSDNPDDLEDLTGKKFVFTAQWGDFSVQYATDDVSPKLTLTEPTQLMIKVEAAITDTWPREEIAFALKHWDDDVGTNRYTYVEGNLIVTQKVDENA